MSKKISIAILFFASLLCAEFKVVGYMPTWDGSAYNVQYDKLTHMIYAFILPTPSGGLTALGNSEASKLSTLVRKCHESGVKISIAVGGWNDGDDSAFETMAASSTARSSFIQNLLQFVENYDLDGVDIDWEYPDMGSSSANFSALMSELSTALHAQGKILSAAVIATGGGSVATDVFESVDFLNLMAYDKWASVEHSPFSYAQQSLSDWRIRGLPQEKAILGVPFYGKKLDSLGSYTAYSALISQDADAPNKDNVGGIWYNGLQTMRNKTTFALEQGGGIMIWELSQDVWGGNSLLGAIDETIRAATPSPTIQKTARQKLFRRIPQGLLFSKVPTELNLVDIRGKKMTILLKKTGTGWILDISSLPKGLYFLQHQGEKSITLENIP